MRAAWEEICCPKPPRVAVSLRKASYSCDNLAERKAFTLNIAPEMPACYGVGKFLGKAFSIGKDI